MVGYDFSSVSALVVEDNRFMREILVSLVKALGLFPVRTAGDGIEAYDALKRFRPDIVLCDIEMPIIDGIEFTRMVRTAADSPNPYVPIIIVSGHTSVAKVEAARAAGMTEFLAKPVTARSLCTRILEVIDRPRPFVRAPEFIGPDRRRHAKARAQAPTRRASDQGLTQNVIVVDE